MQDRAHRLTAIAAHPGTHPEVASRIRSSVRRVERRRRLASLAAHPNTNPAVAHRIRLALSNQGSQHSTTAKVTAAPRRRTPQADGPARAVARDAPLRRGLRPRPADCLSTTGGAEAGRGASPGPSVYR